MVLGFFRAGNCRSRKCSWDLLIWSCARHCPEGWGQAPIGMHHAQLQWVALAALRLLGGTLTGYAGQTAKCFVRLGCDTFDHLCDWMSCPAFRHRNYLKVRRLILSTVIIQLPDPRKNLAKTLAPGLLLVRPKSFRSFSTVWCVTVTAQWFILGEKP